MGTRPLDRLLSESPSWAPGISAPLSFFVFYLFLLGLWETLRPITQMVFQSLVFPGKERLFAQWLGCQMLSDMQGL